MPNALIRFTQNAPGPGVGGNGLAVLGVSGTSVLVENVDNTNVDKAQFEILYVPPGSALTTGIKQAYSNTLTWSFTPDSSECFVIRLRVKDANGNEAIDDRVFGVLESTGRLLPPVARGSAMNFAGNASGWQPYQRAYNKAVDTIDIESRQAGVNITDANQTLVIADGYWRKIAPATLTANRVYVLPVPSGGVATNAILEVTRRDVGNFTATFSDAGFGIVLVMPATLICSAKFRFTGTRWELRSLGTLPFVADLNTSGLGFVEGVHQATLRRPVRPMANLWSYARGVAPPGIP